MILASTLIIEGKNIDKIEREKQRTNKYTQWEEETEKDNQKGKTNEDH
jgi:hypothetical protein